MDKAGIREVAKAAGVSISTVSRAFTRPELVSERTRRKVLETADKLDFNISRSATSLKSGQTYYYTMRAYRTVNGEKIFGSYSDWKTVKVK